MMMNLFLPKQHGAWAMLIIPFWLGVVTTGFMWQHIPFFLGWLFLYLATYPMLLLFKKKRKPEYKKWTIIYIIPAIILLMIPLFTRPSIIIFGAAMLPFFLINAYFSRINKERALINDFSAIFVFCLAGLASSYLVKGQILHDEILAFIASYVFFIGSTFYVKTMIREKKNLFFKKLSWIFHILVIIAWMALGYWVIAIAFLSSLYRAIFFYGKPYSVMKIGVLEIANSVVFFIIMIIALL